MSLVQLTRKPKGNHKSASQLDTFQECWRKWAWRILDGIDGPPNRFAEFGVITHAQLAGYLEKGTAIDLSTPHGECALSGLHYLPLPGTPGMQVEKRFDVHAWGHHYLGYKDVQIITQEPVQIGLSVFGLGVPLVIDHKTTSDLGRAKTAQDLTENIQSVLYAADAMRVAGSQVCDIRFVYYKSRKPWKSQVTDVRVTREDITPTLAKIKDLSDTIDQIKAANVKALDLPFNPEACGNYGGCPYVRNCNLTPEDRMFGFMSNSAPMSQEAFLAQISQMTGGAPGPGINPPALPTSGPPPLPGGPPALPEQAWALPAGGQVQDSPDGKIYWAPGMTGWAPVPAPVASPPALPMPPTAGPPALPDQTKLPGGTGALPPPAITVVVNQPPALPTPPAAPFALPPGGKLSANGELYWAPGMAAWAPVPTPTPAPPVVQEKAKRGRKPKAEGAPEEDPQDLAEKAFTMIGDGFRMLGLAVSRGLWG